MGEGATGNDPLAGVRADMTASVRELVTFELTVGAHVAGMPPVYGTPMMVMAMEKAAAFAVAPHLPEGWVTVGSEVDIRHLAPTPVGRTVTATARVLEVEGRSVRRAHDRRRPPPPRRGRRRPVRKALRVTQFPERRRLKVS